MVKCFIDRVRERLQLQHKHCAAGYASSMVLYIVDLWERSLQAQVQLHYRGITLAASHYYMWLSLCILVVRLSANGDLPCNSVAFSLHQQISHSSLSIYIVFCSLISMASPSLYAIRSYVHEGWVSFFYRLRVCFPNIYILSLAEKMKKHASPGHQPEWKP